MGKPSMEAICSRQTFLWVIRTGGKGMKKKGIPIIRTRVYATTKGIRNIEKPRSIRRPREFNEKNVPWKPHRRFRMKIDRILSYNMYKPGFINAAAHRTTTVVPLIVLPSQTPITYMVFYIAHIIRIDENIISSHLYCNYYSFMVVWQ